jgi:hypothetical protein
MIGKNMTGRSFGGCVRYVINRKKAALLEASGLRNVDAASMIKDFNIQRMMNPKLGKAVGHLVLSWSKEDLPKLSPEIMAERAKEYMELMKIKNTQYVIVQHTDRQNPHVHIVYNRVDNEGRTISDKNNFKRNEIACKAITGKYGYYYAKGKDDVNRDRLKGSEKFRYELFDDIWQILKFSQNWKQFENYLKLHDIQLHYKYKSGTDEIQGVSFSRDNIQLRGSAIDRSLSFANIDKQLKLNRQTEIDQNAAVNTSPIPQSHSAQPLQESTNHATTFRNHALNWFDAFDFGGGASDVDEDEAKRKRRNILKR